MCVLSVYRFEGFPPSRFSAKARNLKTTKEAAPVVTSLQGLWIYFLTMLLLLNCWRSVHLYSCIKHSSMKVYIAGVMTKQKASGTFFHIKVVHDTIITFQFSKYSGQESCTLREKHANSQNTSKWRKYLHQFDMCAAKTHNNIKHRNTLQLAQMTTDIDVCSWH